MKVLVACEQSGVVRDAFRDRGHDAWSCDIEPAGGNHIHGDALDVIKDNWDLMIGHPPCTDISVSGAKHFQNKGLDRIQNAIDFFNALLWAPIPKICLENPVSLASRYIRKPNQIIQPYEFGHMETKKTCLWLVGLPDLKPTENVYDEMMKLPKKERHKVWYASPSKKRGQERSKTYAGIAKAMAEQWG